MGLDNVEGLTAFEQLLVSLFFCHLVGPPGIHSLLSPCSLVKIYILSPFLGRHASERMIEVVEKTVRKDAVWLRR